MSNIGSGGRWTLPFMLLVGLTIFVIRAMTTIHHATTITFDKDAETALDAPQIHQTANVPNSSTVKAVRTKLGLARNPGDSTPQRQFTAPGGGGVDETAQDAPRVHQAVDVTNSSTVKGVQTKLGLARNPGDSTPKRQFTALRERGLTNRLLVVPEYKLLFCYIEKVGCSMFNQLLRLLRVYHPNVSPEEREWLASSHFGRITPDHYNLTARDVSKLIKDDSWTKAVFFRDPADRFFSGFKSKCGKADWDGGRHCRHTFGTVINKKGQERPILGGDIWSFHQAIGIASNRTLTNPHFKHAARFCGGLDYTIDHYQFVHQLDKKTVPGHVKTLFNHLGVDQELADGLVERVVKTGGILHPVDVENIQEKYGVRLRGNISASHNTKSNPLTAKDYFGSPEMLKKLTDAYKKDYKMFQLQPPSWEDLH